MQKFIQTLPRRRLNPVIKDALYLSLGYAVMVWLWADWFERVTR